MNTAQQTFVSEGGAPTQTQRFIETLLNANGEWVSLLLLVGATGAYACHSRAADARKLGYHVENKVVYDKATRMRHSFYRITP